MGKIKEKYIRSVPSYSSEELEKIKKRYSQLLRFSREGVILHDIEGSILEVNDVITNLLGYTKDEMRDKNFLDFTSTFSRADFRRKIRKVRKEKIIHFEINFRRKNGKIMYGQISSGQSSFPEGDFLLSLVKDVTQDKKVLENMQILSQFPEQNPSPILRLDEDYYIRYSNRAGLSFLKAMGSSVNEILPEPLQKKVEKFRKKYVNNEEENQFEWSNGHNIYLVNVSIISGTGYVYLFARDITREKENYEKIKILSKFPEENPNPVIRISPGCKVLYANRASEELLNNMGIRRGDKLPQIWRERIIKMQNNKSLDNNKRNFIQSYDSQVYLFTISLIENSSQIYLYGQDITELRNYEEQLKAPNEELYTFIYKTHHDLKGPLSSLLGLLNLADTEVKDPDAREYLSMINTSAKKLDHILVDLIRVMKIRDPEEKVQYTDLQSFVREIIEDRELEEGSNEVNKKLKVKANQQVPLKKGVLAAVLRNLVINAIKYRDKNKQDPFVEINIEAVNNEIRMQVQDNGIGIEKKYHNRIFNMFYRAHQKTSGNGMGLYIVKKGVEKLNGRIKMDSNPGKGTTFHIYFPV